MSANFLAQTGEQAARAHINLGDWATRNPTTHLADVVAHFLLTFRSPNTRRSYANDLRDFQQFCHDLGVILVDIRDITERTVLLWQAHLEKKHTKFQGARRRIVQSSVARRLSTLSSLLDFAVKRKLIDSNCLTLLNRPKIGRDSKTNALTAEELRLLLDEAARAVEFSNSQLATEKHKSYIRQYRSARLRYAVLFTLLSVGMRVDELCELRIADVEQGPDFTRLHMTAKGSENHSPIIHPKTSAVIKEYVMEFRRNAPPEDFLFVRAQQTSTTTKLTQSAIYRMIQELANKACINKKLSPHSCRATLATLLHNKGVPVGQIQTLLNHKQITTTAIYIKKAEELREAAATKIDILDL